MSQMRMAIGNLSSGREYCSVRPPPPPFPVPDKQTFTFAVGVSQDDLGMPCSCGVYTSLPSPCTSLARTALLPSSVMLPETLEAKEKERAKGQEQEQEHLAAMVL